MDETDRHSEAASRRGTPASLLDRVGRHALTVIFVVVCLGLALAFPSFATPANWVLILQSSAIIGVLAIGLAFVMISGGFDLSFAATMLLAGAVAAQILMYDHDAALLALLAAPAVGAVIGLMNGTLIVLTGISPLLATIATALLIRAFAVLFVMQTWMEVPRTATAFLLIGQGSVAGIPVSVLLFVVVAALAHLVLSYTVLGRVLYAAGANPRAARAAGLAYRTAQIVAYMVAGICAGIAGVINVSSVGGLSAVFNISYLYDVVTAVVIGGVSFFGGVGTIYGVLLGVLILGVIGNAMTIMNTPHYMQGVITGVFLLVAIGVDSWLYRRRNQ